MCNARFIVAADADKEDLRVRGNRHLPGVYDSPLGVGVEALLALFASIRNNLCEGKQKFVRTPAGEANLVGAAASALLGEHRFHHGDPLAVFGLHGSVFMTLAPVRPLQPIILAE